MSEPEAMLEGWTLDEAVLGSNNVRRTRLRSEDDGSRAELLSLHPAGAFGDEVHERWARGLAALHPTDGPGALLARTVHNDHPAILRSPLSDDTLASVAQPLDPSVVAAIGVALGGAMQASGPLLGARFQLTDVALDPSGHPVLAPLLDPEVSLDPSQRGLIAPEVLAGSPPTEASGLYSLGALLHKLATGRLPLSVPSGRSPPASTFRAGVPPTLDRAISALLSHSPSERALGLALLTVVDGARTASLDLRDAAASAPGGMSPGTVKLGRSTEVARAEHRHAHDHADDIAAILVVPAAALHTLSGAEQSRLAGLTGRPMTALTAAIKAGEPLVLDQFTHPRAAQRRADALLQQTGVRTEIVTPTSWARALLWLAGAALTTVAWAGVSSVLTLALGTAAALFSMLFLVIPVAVAGLGVWQTVSARRSFSKLSRSLPDAAETNEASGAIATLRTRVADLRARVAAVDLPEAAAVDLRSALRQAERHLDEQEDLRGKLTTSLTAVDRDDLLDRLRAADRAGDVPLRDRLAQTDGELEALAERVTLIDAELGEVHAALDALASLLGRLADHPVDASGLEALQETTDLTRRALSPVGEATPARPPRGRELA